MIWWSQRKIVEDNDILDNEKHRFLLDVGLLTERQEDGYLAFVGQKRERKCDTSEWQKLAFVFTSEYCSKSRA